MISHNKPRLHSVENIMLTRAMGGDVSCKQIDAVHEEALEVVRPALYEADGGAWKLEAKRNIAAYLGEQLADLVESGKVVVMI